MPHIDRQAYPALPPDRSTPAAAERHHRAATRRTQRFWRWFERLGASVVHGDPLFLLVTTLLAFLLLGYHPYAEDGGIYAAALAAKLDPTLFPHDRPWVTGHTGLALYVPLLAAVVRTLRIPLSWGLLAMQLVSLAATAFALLSLGRLCFRSASVARLATLLVMVAAGVPVAGTSLYLVDPYPTARSLSTPLLLLAIVFALRRRWKPTLALWVTALACHPLMAAWSALPLLLLRLSPDCNPTAKQLPQRKSPPAPRLASQCPLPDPWAFAAESPDIALCAAVFAVVVLVWWLQPPGDPLTLQIAGTRGYWFLSQWHSYELAGALVPPLLLGVARYSKRLTGGWASSVLPLSRSMLLSASTGLLLAWCCAHRTGRTMAIARLQTLRTLHLFYGVFLLLFAGTVLQCTREAYRRVVAVALGTVAALGLAWMQHSLYPASDWLEVPGRLPSSRWEQAFLWARDHTPANTLFAIDAAYTTAAGEDAQGFRAIALRSVLPDAAKDAGIAAVVPGLAPAWQVGSNASAGLNIATDEQRQARLWPLGVTLVVLPSATATALPCPYRNAQAKVCRLAPLPLLAP